MLGKLGWTSITLKNSLNWSNITNMIISPKFMQRHSCQLLSNMKKNIFSTLYKMISILKRWDSSRLLQFSRGKFLKDFKFRFIYKQCYYKKFPQLVFSKSHWALGRWLDYTSLRLHVLLTNS